MTENTILQIQHLTTSFRVNDRYYAAVDDVSLTLRKNEILAVVGESGCGKSTLATSALFNICGRKSSTQKRWIM